MSDTIEPSLGVMNQGWGICGFTSTFYAMHHLNPGTRAWLINANKAYSVLYEIRDYLVAVTGTPFETAITDFTRSFGSPHDQFSFANYIQRIDDSSASLKESDTITDDERFGIGMPPLAVADYVTRMWKWKATVTEFLSPGSATDAIIGVTEDWNGGKPFHGLCHYLYCDKTKVYSWGNVYASLRRAMPKASICYAISVAPP